MKKQIFALMAPVACATFLAAVTSCSENRNGWSISGTVAGANDSTLYIEEPSGAAWIIVDSLRTDANGSFAYQAYEPLYDGQAIYRLRLNDRAVYFPIEGSDAVTLVATNTDMDRVHTLGGTVAARGFNTVDSLINDAVNRVGATAAINDESLLRNIGDIIIADSTCIVSYYAVKHPVEDKALFTLDNSRKLGLLGAAANRYTSLRPEDVRGKELTSIYLNAKKALRGAKTNPNTVEAGLAGRPLLDFVRKDNEGKSHDLNAVLDRGGVTILNLTRYDTAASPANTVALGQLYEKYKDRGLQIYQVSFEPNEAHWRQNASTMPWITVYNRPEDPADILMLYNANPVDGAPVSFVFNSNGEIVERVNDPAELAGVVAKLF